MNDVTKNLQKHYSSLAIKSRFVLLKKLYDRFQYYFSGISFSKSYKAINFICKTHKVKGKNVLDIGCFTGYNSFYFACNGNTVTGLELSDKIEMAQQRYGTFPITFIQDDIIHYLKQNDISEFDFIFCSNLPIHYDTGNIATSSMSETLFKLLFEKMKPNAVLYYIFYSTKQEKVGFPVTSEQLTSCLNKLSINTLHYKVAERSVYDYPMVELVLVKVVLSPTSSNTSFQILF